MSSDSKPMAAAPKRVECDVLVVGSGAGGLAAAVAAAARGLKVIVAEKAPYVGGTTALSGGFMWVPNNPISKADGIVDSVEEARTYLRHEAGNHFNADCVDSFLATGPRGDRLLRDQDQGPVRAGLRLFRLSPDRTGWTFGRSLDQGAQFCRPGARAGAEAAAPTAAGTHLCRPDDRLGP